MVLEAVPQRTLIASASAYEVASPLPLPSEYRLKKDNPRRLAIRREHPLLFRMHRKTEVCGLLMKRL